jgi:hypothetical protein
MMTRDQIKDLVDRTNEMQYRASLFTKKQHRAQPAPAATDAELDSLSRELNRRHLSFPPSLRALLSVYNGVQGYLRDVSLRSTQEIISCVGSDAQWQSLGEFYRFVFASGNTSAFAAFDPTAARTDGEMSVVYMDANGNDERYDDLFKFLRANYEFYSDIVEASEQDRAGLDDD